MNRIDNDKDDAVRTAFEKDFSALTAEAKYLSPLVAWGEFSLVASADAMAEFEQQGRLAIVDDAAVSELSAPMRCLRQWAEQLRTGAPASRRLAEGLDRRGWVTSALESRRTFDSDPTRRDEDGASESGPSWAEPLGPYLKRDITDFAVHLRQIRDIVTIHLCERVFRGVETVLGSLGSCSDQPERLSAALTALESLLGMFRESGSGQSTADTGICLLNGPQSSDDRDHHRHRDREEVILAIHSSAQDVAAGCSRVAFGPLPDAESEIGPSASAPASQSGAARAIVIASHLCTSFHQRMTAVNASGGWNIADALEKFDFRRPYYYWTNGDLCEAYIELFDRSGEEWTSPSNADADADTVDGDEADRETGEDETLVGAVVRGAERIVRDGTELLQSV